MIDTSHVDGIEIATLSGWIDREMCTAGEVQLWDDDEVLALLAADECLVAVAA